MPMDRSLYPKDWDSIARAIKTKAKWRCEECRRPCRRPGESIGRFIKRIKKTSWESDLFDVECPEEGLIYQPKLGRFVLTVAHMDHRPANCDRANLRAWCAPCHCRYDLRAMATKRRIKAEREGQLTLFT